ncbi:MAG: prepilin-type N-terminal cleavage/methylation domain-containing protein [Pseudomonadota bacterium]
MTTLTRTNMRRFMQSGFTLLEMMLAMGLSALLLGMLSAGVYSVVNDWRNETSVLDVTLDKALVMLQMERALMAAFPHTYVDEQRLSRYVYFQGSENELRFVSATSPQLQPGLTAWRLQSDESKGLELTLTPAFSDNPDVRFETLTPKSLLPDYIAEFHYLVQRNFEEKEWLDSWDGEELQSLPLAVHIVLRPLDDDNDEVLELVAPIKTWRHEDIEPSSSVILQ